jgi:hypothetical protein
MDVMLSINSKDKITTTEVIEELAKKKTRLPISI